MLKPGIITPVKLPSESYIASAHDAPWWLDCSKSYNHIAYPRLVRLVLSATLSAMSYRCNDRSMDLQRELLHYCSRSTLMVGPSWSCNHVFVSIALVGSDRHIEQHVASALPPIHVLSQHLDVRQHSEHVTLGYSVVRLLV